jgi:hypothetical protein
MHDRKTWLLACVAMLCLTGRPNVARAGRSRHEQVSVKAIRENGKVVGAVVSMVLVNEDAHNYAKINLVPPSKRESLTRKDAATGLPGNAGMMSKLLFWKERSEAISFDPIVLADREPREVAFEIRYGRGNQLKGGEFLDVVSAWQRSADSDNPHVWGAVLGKDRAVGHRGDIQLPK